MENKYVEEIEELILKINLLAYRIGAKTNHDVFVNFSSHVNYLEVEICKNGWVYSKKSSNFKVIRLNNETAIEELQKTIKVLEKLERGEKDV